MYPTSKITTLFAQAEVALFTVSSAKWREDILTELVHTLIEDTPGEDALDRDCVPFDEAEPALCHQYWYEDCIAAGDFEPDYESMTYAQAEFEAKVARKQRALAASMRQTSVFEETRSPTLTREQREWRERRTV